MSHFRGQAIRIAQIFSVANFKSLQVRGSSSAKVESEGNGFVIDQSIQNNTSHRLKDIPLHIVAWGRSGCQHEHAKVSIVAKRSEYLPFIHATLTPDSICKALVPATVCHVDRIDLPDLNGVQLQLRLRDPERTWNEREAKALARLVLELMVPVPARLVRRDHLQTVNAYRPLIFDFA